VEQAAEHVLRSSMELGGNAPFIVCEDADIAAAVDGAMIAKMRNMGEACTAANRILVHRSVHEEFGEIRLAEKMAALTVGDGLADGVQVGPLVEPKALDKVAELVDDAVDRGAQVASGGGRPEGRGYFWTPTVLTDVDPASRLMAEEIFGPVAPITTFRDESDAIARANATEYGLVGYLFTKDLARAIRVAEALEFGMVGINQGIVSNPAAPFGGVKHSGYGREGGFEGIDEYLETKYIGIAL
jgi:succinate-semialdehyde dehydrogenase/glutarate-semialdehyde dehydrogenase